MTVIRTISPSKATGETAEVYRYTRRVTGYRKMPNIVRAFSLRAASMRRTMRAWELAMWIGNPPRPMRELVAVAVSRMNSCPY